MITTIETKLPKVIGVRLSGKLHDEDFQEFQPQIEAMLTASGKVRLMVQLDDFRGWDLHAALDDIKFNYKHYSDFERIAIVGDRNWEKWMARLCKPFMRAKVAYFDKSEIEAAWKWLEAPEVYPLSAERSAAESESSGDPNPWSPTPWDSWD